MDVGTSILRFSIKYLTFRSQFINMKWLSWFIYVAPNVPKMTTLLKPFAEFANLKGKKLSDLEQAHIEIEWTEDLNKAYQELLEAIVKSSQRHLTTYEPKDPILLFTDSSSDTWSLALFQDKQQNIANDVRSLEPRPLMFLSGSFTTSEVRWHIASKELYPIIYSFERFGFLLRTHEGGIYVYTDHRALLSVIRTKENEKRVDGEWMYRWILKLQSVDMTVYHISSRDNFVRDLLTRLGK
eukprot:snap_masked-scaffold_11-processed-gene-4.26-mRNA-1 protein AED:1.00 eAED:1.00 QI:0/0/0/0/1/1/2/0/239